MALSENPSFQEVTLRHGATFNVDTSDEACEPFGFKSGEIVNVRRLGTTATVMGVAPHIPGSPAGKPALWVRMDGESTVCFFPNPLDDFDRVN